jgi:2-dehydro-3-deoxyphosphogluconate aldolase/(4S)-4-hydroxy-2-oxoglutarate aldolase
MLAETIAKAPVVPLIQADDPAVAVKTVNALDAGGLKVIEVVFRTDAAAECLEEIAKVCKNSVVGAGTILTVEQAEDAVKRGATFIVSPGLDEGVVKFCQSKNIEVFPGTVTASEVQQAWNLGLRTVKFFPASLAGGVPMLKAFGSVFRGMRFMPTGGVSAANLKDYLAVPAVIACGGSWLTPQADIDAGNFEAVTALAKEAMEIAKAARP